MMDVTSESEKTKQIQNNLQSSGLFQKRNSSFATIHRILFDLHLQSMDMVFLKKSHSHLYLLCEWQFFNSIV